MPENDILKQQKMEEENEESSEEVVPLELIEFISSEETSFRIAEICRKNGVTDDAKIEEISYKIARVILGRLPKDKLVMVLENGLSLDAQIAEKITSETSELIFSQIPQLKPGLEQEKPVPGATETSEEPEKPPQKPDTYREPVE